ncbi:MAG TPA: tRNA pseudouridine(38-40) synthase TruA, partial [Eubacteriales bacterium]|nr:tRNA pseudouridine(38-40) synthase TruA [Eubacteriales bacterium]
MRYKMILQYNGTCYSGWQRQKNGVSVQEELEAALSKLYGEEIKAVASGRTDAGVHAEGQVVHFDAPETIPAAKIPLAL